MPELQYIEVGNLFPHPDNPRKEIGDVSELAESIKQNGIFQNLTVVPGHAVSDDEWREMCQQYRKAPSADLQDQMNSRKSSEGYTVIIGHRRLAAAKAAGLEKVACVVADMTPKEQLQTMLLENMQRSDLTVYEQAQGFQLMLDMGSSVEEIAEKSGFSQTTVRRRVKMMELDQEKLKEVSKRQLSLADFDKLAQIEDIKVRNQCLDKMGTHDFNQSVTWELKRQATKKKLPAARKQLKKLGAKEIQNSETWGSTYDSISGYIYLADWEEGAPLLDKKYSGQLFYTLDKDSGCVRFFEKRKRAAPERKSPEQQAREKRIANAWAVIHEQAAVAYQLRSDFVKGLRYTQKNANLILKGALLAGILKATDYMGSNRDAIMDILNQDKENYVRDRGIKVLAAFATADPKDYPTLIYALFDDSPKEDYTGSSYQKQYPEYYPSSKLTGLYAWLMDLGYEMSDEEKAMQDGSHEVFKKEVQA